MSRKCALAALALTSIPRGAADFRQAKKYTEWSEKEVLRMLEDSPWARRAGVVDESRRPERGVRIGAARTLRNTLGPWTNTGAADLGRSETPEAPQLKAGTRLSIKGTPDIFVEGVQADRNGPVVNTFKLNEMVFEGKLEI